MCNRDRQGWEQDSSPTRQFTDTFEDSSSTLFFYHVVDMWLENIMDYRESISKNTKSTLTKTCKDRIELRHEISNNVEYASSKASDQPAHTRSLIRAFASRLNIL